MRSEWTIRKVKDIAVINPKEILKKGTLSKKVSMDKLQPFTRDIPGFELESFSGGSKFRNGDTIMARITPCLENGKTAKVAILNNDEVGFGSTEYIVFRAQEKTDEDFLYYLITSPFVREPAIKSMVGSSGRQRVQTDVVANLELLIPPLDVQKKVGGVLKAIDDKIKLNTEINENLQQQAFALFEHLLSQSKSDLCTLSEIAELNPKRQLSKGIVARCIDMAQLSTSGAFPSGWEMKPYNGGMRFSNGDTIIARITPCLENGKAAFVDFLDDSEVAFGSTEYIILASKGIYPAEFFYCLARYPSFVDYAVKNMNGSSGRQRVSADTLGKYLFPRISEEDISLFRDNVTVMFKAMRNNSLENMRLSVLRDTLLPRLMSGELDISGLDL